MPQDKANPLDLPFQELELLGWTFGRNVEIDVRLATRAMAAVKNNCLCPERARSM
jgi:hypothetical protein